ncbi:MAG: glycosyl hydrolase family 18 protein [Candidatus Limnocylindria bacterium]
MSSRSRLFVVVLSLFVLLGADPARAVEPTGTPAPTAEPDEAAPPGAVSVHAEMLQEHAADEFEFSPGVAATALSSEAENLSAEGQTAAQGGISGLPNGLFREVFGYLPYWMLPSSQMADLDYSLISTIAYFSVGAQSNGTLAKELSSGTPTTGWAGWTSSAMTGVINAAHARDARVVLTVTMMAWNNNYDAMSALLNSSSNRSRLAGEIAAAVKSRNADGVNLDFEPVPTTLRSQYTTFVREVKARLLSQGAGSFLTVATMAGAGTWATGYDIAALSAPGAADALMVMAYDFSWSGSARAGGVAPISSQYIFDSTDALEDYLDLVPASKMIWGVPYYGREWSTTTNSLNSFTNDVLTSSAGYYTFHRSEAAKRGRQWDGVGRVPWYAFWDIADTWVQGYYDDVYSLTAKYDLVNGNGLRGVGIWHLLMDGSRRELWNALETNFRGAWFEDILGSPYRADILWIANDGITAGCGFERFCPKGVVTREQMASFLARALHLPAATRDWFGDDNASQHEADINRVAEAGITAGCEASRFCPRSTVTREQMASFLARALDLPWTTHDWFGDDDASMHEGSINRLAESGITGGCADNRFCPTSPVTREQMAAFLHRAFRP